MQRRAGRLFNLKHSCDTSADIFARLRTIIALHDFHRTDAFGISTMLDLHFALLPYNRGSSVPMAEAM